MKTDNKPKRKSLNQIFSEYPEFIERLKSENKKLKAVNDSLLSALKEIAYKYEEMAKMSCADNHIDFRVNDFTTLSIAKAAIKQAEEL